MMTDLFAQQASSCQGLLYNVLQRPLLPSEQQGFTAALVAAHPGAGTSHLTSVLGTLLDQDPVANVLALDCRQLANLSGDPRRPPIQVGRDSNPAYAISCPPVFHSSWRSSRDYRAAYLAQLRERFAYVLIDCPSLKEGNDILGLAPLVNGVMLVIEANRTSRSQIAYLERTIENAGGKILGHLLNKRTYPIPEWVHNKLEGWGI